MSGNLARRSTGPVVHLPHDAGSDEPPIRVMALHALLYCERLYYLEEVEEDV